MTLVKLKLGSENWASVQMELQSLVGKREERKAGEHCSDCISGLFAGLEDGESSHRYISTSAFTGRSQHVSAACWTTSIASRIAFPGTHHSPPRRAIVRARGSRLERGRAFNYRGTSKRLSETCYYPESLEARLVNLVESQWSARADRR